MRKVDYQMLAQVFREGIAFAQVQHDAVDSTSDGRTYYRGRLESLKFAAGQFAERASVDKWAFLVACGIQAPDPNAAARAEQNERIRQQRNT